MPSQLTGHTGDRYTARGGYCGSDTAASTANGRTASASSEPTLIVVSTSWTPAPSRVPRAFTPASTRMTTAVSACRGQNASTSTACGGSPGRRSCFITSWNDSVNMAASAAIDADRMMPNSTHPHRNPAIRPYPSRRNT